MVDNSYEYFSIVVDNLYEAYVLATCLTFGVLVSNA